ncbi:MAG: NADPH-dependent FMN reductase [Eubacterium sp.]|nr:NADPH-dependent FMN reductase [Eubacterium sp.]
MAKKVLVIVGSTRKDSFNKQVAEVAAEQLGAGAEVSFLDYSDVPFVNQDTEFPAPEAVARVREAVMAADGLWIQTPEYNFSYPGVVKNLLDWLSRPLKAGDFASGTAIAGKKTAICGVAGKSAAAGSRAKLRELLTFIKAEVMEEETGIVLNPEAFTQGKLILSEESKAALRAQTEAFLKFIQD